MHKFSNKDMCPIFDLEIGPIGGPNLGILHLTAMFSLSLHEHLERDVLNGCISPYQQSIQYLQYVSTKPMYCLLKTKSHYGLPCCNDHSEANGKVKVDAHFYQKALLDN